MQIGDPLHGVELRWQVKIDIAAALLRGASATEEAPAPGMELLGNVLQGAAAEAQRMEASPASGA